MCLVAGCAHTWEGNGRLLGHLCVGFRWDCCFETVLKDEAHCPCPLQVPMLSGDPSRCRALCRRAWHTLAASWRLKVPFVSLSHCPKCKMPPSFLLSAWL